MTTTHIPNSHLANPGKIVYSSLCQGEALQDDRVICSKDTIAQAQVRETQEQATPGLPVKLPPAQSQLSQDDLMILADAFCKVYSSMNQGVILQVKSFTQLQQLDQTNAKITLDSATNAIAKQEAVDKVAADIAAYQKKMTTAEYYFNAVMTGLGVVALVVVFLGSFLTGLLPADAALPEDIEMIDLGSDAGDATESDSLSDFDVPSTSSGDVDLIEEESCEDELSTDEDLNKTTSEASTSEESFKNKCIRMLAAMGLGAAFGSPRLLSAVASFAIVDKKDRFATLQQAMGQAIALQQKNNMFFQFVQQLLQRSGGVVTEETKDSSEVVDTFASISNAYRSIPQGLANSI